MISVVSISNLNQFTFIPILSMCVIVLLHMDMFLYSYFTLNPFFHTSSTHSFLVRVKSSDLFSLTPLRFISSYSCHTYLLFLNNHFSVEIILWILNPFLLKHAPAEAITEVDEPYSLPGQIEITRKL